MASSKKNLFACLLFASYLLLGACGGGSGTNGGNNDKDFTISGQVTGINAGSVALKNRDSAPVVISNDGSFSFSSVSSAGYDIQITKNPIEQLCRVENGSANSINGDINNIQVICESVATAPACNSDADSDGDNLSDCQELNRFKTNPWLADTDGDGYPDDEEATIFDPANNTFRFNPRIADMAVIAVDLTSLPQIELDFSDSLSNTRSVVTSYEQSQASGISKDWGGKISRQLEIGHTVSTSSTNTVGVEVELAIDGGVTGSFESSLTLGYESSTTQTRGSSLNWNTQQSVENKRAYSESGTYSETTGTTYDGGTLLITARVRNPGHIAYDLENLTLSAVLFDPQRPFSVLPIGNLSYADGSFPTTSITTGSESAPLNFSTELSLQKAQQLLRDSSNILITASTYRLLDADDRSILLVDEDVAARTAFITVDYGIDSARQDKYRVAINNGDGSKAISAATALKDVLGLSISEGVGEWVYGNDTVSSRTKAGLLSVNDFSIDSSTNKYWLVAHNHNSDNGAGARSTDFYHVLLDDYNLDNVMLRARDHLTLVYVGDADRDALSDRLEEEYGTDPTLPDTDNDGLGDAVEIYGWETNLGVPPCDTGNQFRVYSNPLLADSDNDGTPDNEEKDACDNPSFDFVAEAGDDQTVNIGEQTVTLQGAIKGIASGNASYNWRLMSGPEILVDGSTTNELEGKEPTFTAPSNVSTLVFELAVTIGGETQTDTVSVQVMLNSLKSVFVGSSDSTEIPDGTQDNPYPSISEALTFISAGEDLYVMTQTTPYSSTNSLTIPDGSSLFGGYDANWVRNVYLRPTPIVLNASVDLLPAIDIPAASSNMWISGFSISVNDTGSNGSNNLLAMRIGDGTSQAGSVYVINNALQSDDVSQGRVANPGSSYALIVNNLANLFLHDNVLRAGRGGLGAKGANGAAGKVGDSGTGKQKGAGGKGGNGGAGGGGFVGATAGKTGAPNGKGGKGSGGAKVCKSASTGGSGGAGRAGSAGSAAGGFQANDPSRYQPVNGGVGSPGSVGKGGGGGGGGGGCGTAAGGSGGRGGEGGTGGQGGVGGIGGGASIALWLSGVAAADIRGNNITSGMGGNAGNGGAKGPGGNGGAGAAGSAGRKFCILFACDRGGAGAAGGKGGSGGIGGVGSGGSGGPSFGIYVGPDIAPVLNNNNITSGKAGSGGHWGNSGNGGHSYAIFDADTGDGRNPLVAGSNVLSVGTAGAAGLQSGGESRGDDGLSGEKNF